MSLTAFVVGVLLAAGVSIFAKVVKLDRDGAFYPTVMIVIALIYVLFAAMTGSVQTILLEAIGTIAFTIAAVIGFKTRLWIVAAALAAHGIFDAFHGQMVSNPGVPEWWPSFCAAYDIVAGGCMALLLWSGSIGTVAAAAAVVRAPSGTVR